MQAWWQTLYDENLARILLEPENNDDAEATLCFLQQYIGLQPGQSVLDQCCGTGRLSQVLARDHQLIGVDIIPQYIEKAQSKLQQLSLEAEFFCDDALNFSTENPVDFVVNWWTSFGYSEDDDINLSMLKQAYQSLKLGGTYVLDFMNVPGIYRHFKEDVMNTQETERGTMTLVRHSRIDFEKEVLLKDWHYFFGGEKSHVHHSAVRLYGPAMLKTMFEQAGFSQIQLFGDLAGNPLGLDSPRCIISGKKI